MSARGRGRGAYYKARYGNGRTKGRVDHGASRNTFSDDVSQEGSAVSANRTWSDLRHDLTSIDGQGYGAYNRLRGTYQHYSPDFKLSVDRVQSDAYASPSRVSVRMSWEETGLPSHYASSEIRMIALADWLSRKAADYISDRYKKDASTGQRGGWSGLKGEVFGINRPKQEILPRTSVMVVDNPGDGKNLELRLSVSLPARGRTILGGEALSILVKNLPELVKTVMLHANHDKQLLKTHIESTEDQNLMRSQLADLGLVAFIANGSVLPRASGASERPLADAHMAPFHSPASFEVTLKRLHGKDILGMGIKQGITLLTGCGYHGKSTLLEAIQLGVYDHVPGDGRELVVTDPTAVKIRAEDGRSVTSVDITPFIRSLPGKVTNAFTSEDASGSTSMAASIQEALEADSKTIIIDEDSSARNLLVRDERMQKLVLDEPITPFFSKARALYTEHGVSTIIVVGGLGDWLSVADKVIGMESFTPRDLTEQAKTIVDEIPRRIIVDTAYGSLPHRRIHVPQTIMQRKGPWAKTKNFITIPKVEAYENDSDGEGGIDLSHVEQLIETGQSKLIAHLITSFAKPKQNENSFAAAIAEFERNTSVDTRLSQSLVGGDFVAVRKFELSAAISRLQGLITETDNTAQHVHKKQRTEH
ncbi:hypothetical protein AAFC00_001662 [Neodothiora populina]|uniref:Isopentenyl-diphosphate delta-isomerase n=1 Tax=Neodothiora populina TaxID=2781224 RepID=A0ABR3PQ47_9PEZI